MIQAEVILSALKALLHGPPQPGGTRQLAQFCTGTRKDKIIGACVRFAPVATDEKPTFPLSIRTRAQRNTGPILEPKALGTFSGCMTGPGSRLQFCGHCFRISLLVVLLTEKAQAMIGSNCQTIRLAAAFQHAA